MYFLFKTYFFLYESTHIMTHMNMVLTIKRYAPSSQFILENICYFLVVVIIGYKVITYNMVM